MRWGWRWPERRPRPEIQRLSHERRDHILATLSNGIASSPVLSHLGIRVRALRGRFYLERLRPGPEGQAEVEVIGRVTPLASPKHSLLLEVEKSLGNWYEVERGSAKKIVNRVATDTKGTFHGLGALDKSLRKGEDGRSRLKVKMQKDCRFFYADTGEGCTVQEALFHFFGVPIDVIAEPREWYRYHRKPEIAEVSEDQTRVLIQFTTMSMSGASFGGTCLYARSGREVAGVHDQTEPEP